MQAGLKLLSEGGVEGLSLRAAAQLAGVSDPRPTDTSSDKDALVSAVAEQGFRLLSASMRAEVERSGEVAGAGAASTRDRLRALGRGYLRFATEHPAYLQVIFGGVLSKELTTPELQAAGKEAYGLLRDTVGDGVARGELREADPELISLATWSLVHGLSHLLSTGRSIWGDWRPSSRSPTGSCSCWARASIAPVESPASSGMLPARRRRTPAVEANQHQGGPHGQGRSLRDPGRSG